MRMLWCLLLAPACTPSSPIAMLADLPAPHILGQQDGFAIEYDTSGDCFTLSADVHAVVDGRAASLSTGGWQDYPDGAECQSIGVGFGSALANNAVTSIELTD